MRQYHIRGNTRVAGQIAVGGAKNAVLPILAAVCLNKGESEIHNCPRIADTFISIKILKHIGCRVEFTGNTLYVDASNISVIDIPEDWVSQMRSSILFMGAMLGRTGQINIAYPGGCDLGERSIGYHIEGLRAMGVEIIVDNDILRCKGKLKGANIQLASASVGATENLMLAGALADGTTVIANAAKEPEVVDLARFLNSMGAYVHGAGTDKIIIEGVQKFTSTTYRVMPDRIVAGTYMVAAAMTGGEINLTNIRAHDLAPTSSELIKMGCKINYGTGNITIKGPQRLNPLQYLETAEHPGFPTDMQAQFVAALALADGHSTVLERIYESRDAHAKGLNLMGADIGVHSLPANATSKKRTLFEIQGQPVLTGAVVEANDLRGGAALVLAGIAAQGDTVVQNAHYVERGYECIEKDLSSIGVDICLEVLEDKKPLSVSSKPE
ncbi:MAG: UDP-N-acetylglucosamine 1-carboxyvinyltransferase [Defluviitaleaceae bacterium]|nr:UDP-N-acetylglucosamine 1-carboxyvinyltransferase [Defluviitaleaceae bacterium]